jgi:hypothetical protein
MWSLSAGAWLVMFIASASRAFTALVPALAVAIAFNLAPLLGSAAAAPQVFFGVMLAACANFALWFWWTRAVRRPLWTEDRSPLGFGNFTIRPLESVPALAGGNFRSRALRAYLLGTTSSLSHIAAGAIPALAVLVMIFAMPETPTRQNPADFLFLIAMLQGTIGFMIVRRARQMWLRAGLGRSALFRLVERIGLPTSLLTFGAGAAILVPLTAMLGQPEQAPLALLFAAALLMLATGVFYFGLSLTRGWNGADVMIGAGIFFLFIAVSNAIKLGRDPSIAALWIGTGVFALMTLLMRWRAMRRWRALDWRIARLSTTGRSAS